MAHLTKGLSAAFFFLKMGAIICAYESDGKQPNTKNRNYEISPRQITEQGQAHEHFL